MDNILIDNCEKPNTKQEFTLCDQCTAKTIPFSVEKLFICKNKANLSQTHLD